MKHEISILLPVRDAETTLGSCLRSVERQTDTRWECVIVDDGSRDHSARIAHELAARDERFLVVEMERQRPARYTNPGEVPHSAFIHKPEDALVEACRLLLVVRRHDRGVQLVWQFVVLLESVSS